MTAIVSKLSYLQQHIPDGEVDMHLQVQSSMDIPALFELPPGPAAACIMQHLSKHDKQQLALTCKHAHTFATAGVAHLTLGHKWYHGSQCRTVFPNCVSITLKPRTVDELGKLTTQLLIHKVQRLPALAELRLDLQGVYDKMWDISLMLKSVALHTKQLTSIYIDQGAMVSAKAMGYLEEMPALTSITIKTRHGFEIGALASLGRASSRLTSLTLEIAECSLDSPAAAFCGNVKLPPSELARLQASDEVGLAKCVGLVNLTVSNFTQSGTAAFRPVEALLQAIAGSMEPRLKTLTLANMPNLPVSVLETIAEITSLQNISLAGSGLGSSPNLAKLSALERLQALNVAPQQPSSEVLDALAKGCKKLTRLAMGAGQVSFEALCMPEVTELQLLAALPRDTAPGSSSTAEPAGVVSSSMSGQVKPPVQLSGLSRVWPHLTRLEISGYVLDAAAVREIGSLRELESLKIVGASDAAVSAKLLLPLLSMPTLQRLQLLELTDLTDCWVSEAIRAIGSTPGAAFAEIRELQLGAAATSADLSSSGSSDGGSSSSDQVSTATTSVYSNPSQFLTDKGVVRLFACPKLQKLSLVQLPGITLAGVKALVRGSQTLQAIDITRCQAISAVPAEAIAKVAVAAPGRSVNVEVH